MSSPTTERPAVVEERPSGSRLRTLLVITIVAAIVVGGGWWVSRPTTYGGSDAVAVTVDGAAAAPRLGTTAPDFTAITTTGEEVTLAQLRGRPVWITFGASWCAPCRVEAPDIQAAHAASLHGVQVVAVYLGEDTAAVDRFAATMGLTYTHIPDPDRSLAAAWGVNGIPVHWFLDAEGTVVTTRVGIVGPDQIEGVLAQVAVPVR